MGKKGPGSKGYKWADTPGGQPGAKKKVSKPAGPKWPTASPTGATKPKGSKYNPHLSKALGLESEKVKTTVKSDKSKKPHKKSFSSKKIDLLELGGTQEDIDLLAGIEDDAETLEFDEKADSKMAALSAEMMKIIGDVNSSEFMVDESESEDEEPEVKKVDEKPSKSALKKAELSKNLNLTSDMSKILNKEEVDEVAFFGDGTEEKKIIAKKNEKSNHNNNPEFSEDELDSDTEQTEFQKLQDKSPEVPTTPEVPEHIIWKYPTDSVENPNLPNRSLFSEEDLEQAWYNIVPDNHKTEETPDNKNVPIRSLKIAGMKLLQNERDLFKSKNNSDIDSAIFEAGTLTDKVAIMCSQIEESPLTSFLSLKELFEMIDSKARRKYLVTLYGSETVRHVKENGKRVAKVAGLKTLLFEGFLPKEKPLRSFEEHNLRDLENMQTRKRNRLLAIYFYEDYVKQGYSVNASNQ